MTEPPPPRAVLTEPRSSRGPTEPERHREPTPGLRQPLSRRGPVALVGLACLFAALSLYTTFSSETGRYVPDDRLEDVLAPEQYLKRHTYLWDDSRTLGNPTSSFYFTPATAAFQTATATLGAPPWVIERLTHALFLFLAAFGVLLLMREFRPSVDLAHAIAAFVYTFSPFTSQYLLPSGLFLIYALAPWLAWIAARGLRDRDPWRWAAAFALVIAAAGASNIAALGLALLPAAMIAVYFTLQERRGAAHLWGWVWRAGLLTVLTCSAAIVVLMISGPELSTNLRTTELPEHIARTSSWSESWRGLGFWLTYFLDFSGGLLRPGASAYFTAPDVMLATFVAPLFALLTLALGRWRHRALFGAMLLVSLVLVVGIHDGSAPFGKLLSFSFDHSDAALGFRTTYKAGAGLMLAIAVLAGVGIASAVAAAGQRRPDGDGSGIEARYRPFVLGIAVPVVVAVALVVGSTPFWTDHLYPEDGFKRVPTYWDRAFDHLDKQEQPGRVLVLPGAEQARYRWGNVHDSLFDGLSPLTPVMNHGLPQGTAESADLVTAIDEYVSSPGYVPGTLAPILARLGVRWVLLQNDLDWQGMRVPRPSTFTALRFDPDLRRVATFGRRGENTAAPGDPDATFFGERTLPPVELYEVAGKPSPRPKVASGPPLLVAGGGDSWPSLASTGLLNRGPVAYTGAAKGDLLREMFGSGSDLVVTDGNRRRSMLTGTIRPTLSPTLAADEPASFKPADLFDHPDTQSVVAFADADWITASRYGFPLSPFEASSRPANAFDGIERTAWTVRGPLDSDGESLTVKLREPQTITGVSVLPHADGPWRVKAVDVILHSPHGDTRKRISFGGVLPERARTSIAATEVNTIELRIAQVDGPGAVGLAGVGIAEVGVTTPDGPLDLREFVRTPNDLAIRAAANHRLAAELAARPPRYELRRITGVGTEDEETELRREITAFGDHRYELHAAARVNSRTPDGTVDALLGAPVGAVGSSRSGGDLRASGSLAVDGDLSTGWVPEPIEGQRIDLHFPVSEVSTVEVLVLSGPLGRVARSRVTAVDVAMAKKARVSASSTLPRTPQCATSASPVGDCIETHVVHLPPTRTGQLSVTLTGIKPVVGRFGRKPPKVVEVRINGSDLSGLAAPLSREACAPLFAVDGRPVPVQLPRPENVLAGKDLQLKGCEPIPLDQGTHRIESLADLSGAVLTTTLLPLGRRQPARTRQRPSGNEGAVNLVDHSPTELDLQVHAPQGALLVGEMPWHQGWAADGGDLRRYPVPLDTFSAWMVEAPTDDRVTLRFTPQATYELAMALSIAAAAWCLWRATRRRRRDMQ